MSDISIFHKMLDRDPGVLAHDEADRLMSRNEPAVVRDEARFLLIRLDGNYYVETHANVLIAAQSDPDFVTAIPLADLRPLVLRSIS